MSIGRWVLLGLLSLQAIAVIFALVVRRVLRRRAYEEFKDVEAPSQQDRRAQREADMQDLREKVLGSQHALAGGAPPATALDFKIATVAAANRAELMGAEDGNLAAVDPRTSAVAPQAGGAPAPLSRCVNSCSGSGWLWSYGEAPDLMAPHLLSSPSSHFSTGPYLPGRQSSMPNLVRPTSSPAGPGQLRLPRRRQSSGTASSTSSTGKCLVDMCAPQLVEQTPLDVGLLTSLQIYVL